MKKKILIIDDDPQLREMYQAALEMEGYEVVIKSDGEEALDFIMNERQKPDLILLDIMIPKIHGLDVLNAIKTGPNTKDTKVIMLSALSDEATKKKASKYGANSYFVKSELSMSEFIGKIKKTLEK